MPRGGRRRGAGAPFGNVNALVSARSSRRYKLAYYFVAVLDPFREYALANGPTEAPAVRQRLQHAMDIAASILRNVPELPDLIERLLNDTLKGHAHEVSPASLQSLLAFLNRPAETHYERLLRALDLVAWCRKYHTPTYVVLSDYLMAFVAADPDYQPGQETASKNPQSNNQSIKDAATPQPWRQH
jgi:hypothetical protein